MVPPSNRPWLVTIFCLLGFTRSFFLMVHVASPRALEVGGWYSPGLTALALSMIFASYYLWRMNSKGLWAAVLAVLFQALVVLVRPVVDGNAPSLNPVLEFSVPFLLPVWGLLCGWGYRKRMAS